jgi:structural maintenance of chromosome 2
VLVLTEDSVSEGLKKSIEKGEEQLEAVAAAVKGWEEEVEQTKQLVATAEAEVKDAEAEVKKQKEIISRQSAEINAKTRRTEEIKKENSEKGLEIQELEHSMKRAAEAKAEADRRVKHMLQEYDWIQAEKQFFGQPNSIYDFKVSLWMAVLLSLFFYISFLRGFALALSLWLRLIILIPVFKHF